MTCLSNGPLSEFRKNIEAFNPEIVGISCLSSSVFSGALSVASLVKQVDPEVKVCIGGAHPSALPHSCLTQQVLDFVVIGEGEETFVELCHSLAAGSDNLCRIRGLAYKDNGQIVSNERRPFIENLDALPFPARELFPMEKYRTTFFPFGLREHVFGNIITSRGCPYDCLFCSVHTTCGYRWRTRSPRSVVDEIELLVSKYGVKEIFIEDDNMTLSRKRTMEICRNIIDRGIDVKWRCRNGVHISTLNRSLLKQMADAGCYAMAFGIESGDANVLHNIIGKEVSLDMARNVIRWAKGEGIKTEGFFILGHPGEDFRSFQRTIEFATSLPLDVADFFIATPYPGTRLYQLCLEKGYISHIKDWSTFTASQPQIATEAFSAPEVKKWARTGKRQFYLRTSYFLKHLGIVPYAIINLSYFTMRRLI